MNNKEKKIALLQDDAKALADKKAKLEEGQKAANETFTAAKNEADWFKNEIKKVDRQTKKVQDEIAELKGEKVTEPAAEETPAQ